MPRITAEQQANHLFRKSMKEAENIGAAHQESYEFSEAENDRIKAEQKKMWEVLRWKSKENWKKVRYVEAAKTLKERRERMLETKMS